MNFGCFAGGTLLRSELDVNALLDYWSFLGLPLLVGLSLPSADGPDPKARQKIDFSAGSWSPAAQQAWTARLVPLILAKTGVQAVGLESVRRRATARLSPCRPTHASGSSQARPAHAGSLARGLHQSASDATLINHETHEIHEKGKTSSAIASSFSS